jgi:predicted amidohydrolase
MTTEAPVAVLVAAACQLALAVGDVEANMAAAEVAVREAAAAGAQLVVLPELTPSGYVFTSLAEAVGLAQPLDGPAVTAWTALAAELDLVIVGGLSEQAAGEKPWNSSVVVDRTGLLAAYHKVHLWHDEPDFFVAGTEPPPVVETAVGRVATMVCYDVEFPEWVRLAALGGADVLAVPTNWPTEPVRARPTPMEAVRVQAAASINRLAIVAADRCAVERGVVWTGGSCIVEATGHLVAGPPPGPDPVVLVGPLDLGLSRQKATGPRNDALGDRRPELYGPVARRG